MKHKEEIEELNKRLAIVEHQLQQKSSNSKLLKYLIGFVVVLFVIFTLIGIVQFVLA